MGSDFIASDSFQGGSLCPRAVVLRLSLHMENNLSWYWRAGGRLLSQLRMESRADLEQMVSHPL